jgi:hypothetical protein
MVNQLQHLRANRGSRSAADRDQPIVYGVVPDGDTLLVKASGLRAPSFALAASPPNGWQCPLRAEQYDTLSFRVFVCDATEALARSVHSPDLMIQCTFGPTLRLPAPPALEYLLAARRRDRERSTGADHTAIRE